MLPFQQTEFGDCINDDPNPVQFTPLFVEYAIELLFEPDPSAINEFPHHSDFVLPVVNKDVSEPVHKLSSIVVLLAMETFVTGFSKPMASTCAVKILFPKVIHFNQS